MCADLRIDTIYASGNLFCMYLVCAKSPTFIGGSLRSRVSAVSVAIAVNTATIAATLFGCIQSVYSRSFGYY